MYKYTLFTKYVEATNVSSTQPPPCLNSEEISTLLCVTCSSHILLVLKQERDEMTTRILRT